MRVDLSLLRVGEGNNWVEETYRSSWLFLSGYFKLLIALKRIY